MTLGAELCHWAGAVSKYHGQSKRTIKPWPSLFRTQLKKQNQARRNEQHPHTLPTYSPCQSADSGTSGTDYLRFLICCIPACRHIRSCLSTSGWISLLGTPATDLASRLGQPAGQEGKKKKKKKIKIRRSISSWTLSMAIGSRLSPSAWATCCVAAGEWTLISQGGGGWGQ